VPRSAKNFATSARLRRSTAVSIVRAVDVSRALAELTEVSSQIRAAVVVDADGAVLGATPGTGEALAEAGRDLLAQAASLEGREPTQVDASTADGSVFLLRDGARTIVATTTPEPTVGLVFYDLRSCLAALGSADDDAA
jgi:predicted regulator of Ras-like GTPase activity (Roadblock/LC7/MglB family)